MDKDAKKGLIYLAVAIGLLNGFFGFGAIWLASEYGIDLQKLMQIAIVAFATILATSLALLIALKKHGHSTRDLKNLDRIIGKVGNIKWFEAKKRQKEYDLSNDLGIALVFPIMIGWMVIWYIIERGDIFSSFRSVLFMFGLISNCLLFYFPLVLLVLYPFARLMGHEPLFIKGYYIIFILFLAFLAIILEPEKIAVLPLNSLFVCVSWLLVESFSFFLPESLKLKRSVKLLVFSILLAPLIHASISCTPLVLFPFMMTILAESGHCSSDLFVSREKITIITSILFMAFLISIFTTVVVLRIFGYEPSGESIRRIFNVANDRLSSGNYEPLKDALFWILWPNSAILFITLALIFGILQAESTEKYIDEALRGLIGGLSISFVVASVIMVLYRIKNRKN